MKTENDNRSRPILKRFFVNEEEEQLIEEQKKRAGLDNFSTFARLMLTTGQVKVVHFEEVIALRKELNRIGVNINQIAKMVNTDEVVTVESVTYLNHQLELIEQHFTKLLEVMKKESRER
ncbi:UNVERIFIED_CONTAM: plasmid mobilization relaxosome protein MobC [Streptococcus canis]|uniref:Plasmid mobilization relaxosome protein MobC n=2 Tax=Streptococcus canis TaxID=1329 RepID=A0AAE4TRI7_STRCB|nr:plasmid mobilization relaxosome protein MobC [Streptococcus canis]MDV5976831.1 plasmid mobilization relaxosome protein MobC [Streptococcus canis]QKG74774.1 plasmid mobilization relaxosome protein MobC [Streptococcus canis]QKG76623.1 plasmid mobilization relaxosome protein MobC [Streptococcus canis]GFE45354.1 mobilization protein [Streptococcus canis]GMX39415.1 plasmid mobilization relaxosome protein MobC [Streptococcus canis]